MLPRYAPRNLISRGTRRALPDIAASFLILIDANFRFSKNSQGAKRDAAHAVLNALVCDTCRSIYHSNVLKHLPRVGLTKLSRIALNAR